MKRAFALLQSLGVNYAWGLINFTAGVALGGAYVAFILISAGVLQ